MSVKIVSWNIGGTHRPWHTLVDVDADVALLQEAGEPPSEVKNRIEVDPAPWGTAGLDGARSWRTAIARLSDGVTVEWINAKPLDYAAPGELGVSRFGTLSAAQVNAQGIEPFVVASMYSLWTRPYVSTGSSWIVPDASAHRLLSDLSVFIGRQSGHRVLAAGDLNILHGYGDCGDEYWAGRYASVFDRMEALGMSFVGPQHPNGRQAEPWPDELPRDSKNVPTYRWGNNPDNAKRQLDFVFASETMADSVCVRPLNEPEQWGPSDHCQIEITVS